MFFFYQKIQTFLLFFNDHRVPYDRLNDHKELCDR